MKYQLVLQLSGDSELDLDAIVELEDKLIDALGDYADVDGHDIGSGQTNLFLFTSDPAAAFQAAKPVLQKAGLIKNLTAAFRDVDGEDYTVIWPTGSTRQFEIV
jgi:hypothetical protein